MLDFIPKSYPESPGVYLMKDKINHILYIGKAKSLRKRLSSYFRSSDKLPGKVRSMMPKVESIDILCTGTEKEALLLEASLIKKHKPKYNIILKDDKQFILFKLNKKNNFPRLTRTRKVNKDGSIYFGPFTSAQAAWSTFQLVNKLFPLRKCSDKAMRNRVRACLQYDIGRCLAPCVKKISVQDYAKIVRQVELFLGGKNKELISKLYQEMQIYSDKLEFEKAAKIRDQILAIEKTTEQQSVVLPGKGDLDIIGIAPKIEGVALAILFVRQGKLLDARNYFWPQNGPENELEAADFLRSFIVQFYTRDIFIPSKIIPCFEPADKISIEELLKEIKEGEVKIAKARGIHEKKLVDMAISNAAKAENKSCKKNKEFLIALSQAFKLPLIKRIECIDASHLSGQGMRVGMVVYIEGLPVIEQYRIYKFEELDGSSDDYMALKFFLEKRLQAGPPWPDLLLIDGGKGQLNALQKLLEKNEQKNIFSLASIAKGQTRRAGELEDRIFVPGRKNPLSLKPGSRELLFLQTIRDSAHNFVIRSQRKSRNKNLLQSSLENLPGIGPKTANLLWQYFESIEAMKNAKLKDIQKMPGIGHKKAEFLLKTFKQLPL